MCLAFVQYPDVIPDELFTALRASFVLGFGFGLAMRREVSLDGTLVGAENGNNQTERLG